MPTNVYVKKYLVTKATIRSLVAVLGGSSIFILGEMAAYTISNSFADIDIWSLLVFGVVFTGTIAISFPISLAAGIWLAFDLYNTLIKKTMSIQEVFLKGLKLGVLVGISLSVMVVGVYFLRGDWHILLFQATLGTIVSSLTAGWVAVRLMHDIAKIL
jgi:hypothetical protein